MTNIKYKFTGSGLEGKEKNWSKKQFEIYRKNYSIDNFSDLQILESLVFRETMQERYKIKIAELNKNKKVTEENLIPTFILDDLDKNLKQILELKTKLGLFIDKKDSDTFKEFKKLDKKFKIWMSENQGSRTLVCPWCSKLTLLKIKTEAWEALKHPFFKDKILANEPLWKVYKEGKITKDEQACILGVAPDYIDWLEEHIFVKESK